MMKRVGVLVYGVVCYAVFFATFCYAMGFVTNVGVPKTIDSPPTLPARYALLVNLGLLVIFAVQHSVMARPAFKKWWTQFVPQAMERSTYTLFSSLALIALFYFWQPLGGAVWDLTGTPFYGLAALVGLAGWMLVLFATFLINHFDLFGLRQSWLYFRGREYSPLQFGTPVLYRHMRHPLYLGWFMAFWGAPVMTVAHLFFALVTTIYIVAAVQLEERDLAAHHGTPYVEYRKRVPMFFPRLLDKRRVAATEQGA